MSFQYRDRAKQLIDFSHMEYGVVHPTDIDAILDLKGKGWIFFEVKTGQKDVPLGQRICLERLVDNMNKSGKYAVSVVCEHYTPPGKDIDLSQCVIRKVYYKGRWLENYYGMLVKEFTDNVVKKVTNMCEKK